MKHYRKYFTVVFISVINLSVLFGYPIDSAIAAVGCDCNVTVKDFVTTDQKCQINKSVTFELDKITTVKDLIDKIPFSTSCDSYGHLINEATLMKSPLNEDDQECFFKSAIEIKSIYSYSISCNIVSVQGKTDPVYKSGKDSKSKTAATSTSGGGMNDEIKLQVEKETNDAFNKINTVDARVLIARLISTLIGILGSIALVMFIYGGILWMSSSGAAEKEEKARHILVWGSLGLAVIFASYAILQLVFGAFK